MKLTLYYLLPIALLLTSATNVVAQEGPAANLVHSYTFENGAEDEVGDADGVLVGGAEILEGALVITAQDQWMEMPGQTIGINGFEEITLEILYTPNLASGVAGGNTGFTMLAYFGSSNDAGQGTNYYFLSTARGDDVSRAAISVGVETSPWSGESGANGPEFDDLEMHHMVSTLTADEITLYLDGELTGNAALADNNFIGGISTEQAYLARGGYINDPEWQGVIHEFNIYNRAVTAEEVAQMFSVATAVERLDMASVPQRFALSQNYPNPFNPTTTIEFAVTERSPVEIAVFDLLGTRVATLVSEEVVPGSYKVDFDATGLSSGVYFYAMRAGSFSETRKLILMK